jgi:hypothetical protein
LIGSSDLPTAKKALVAATAFLLLLTRPVRLCPKASFWPSAERSSIS